MNLLLCPSTKRALVSLFYDQDATIPDMEHGETIPLSVGVVDPVNSQPFGSQLYIPRDLTGWTFRAAIGNGYALPVAGSFVITYGANTTTPLAYNCTAADIAAALNALASIIAAGGVTVTGGDGFFIVTFSAVGVRTALSGDASDLAPLSVAEFTQLIAGAAAGMAPGKNEVQTLRLTQNPPAFNDLTVASPAPSATPTVVQAGDGGHNAKVRIVLSPAYDGQWTITVNGVESAFISSDASGEDVQSAIEAIAGVGIGQILVTQETPTQFLLMFFGTMAHTAVTVAADGSSLLVVSTMSGTVDLRTPGVDLFLGGASSAAAFFSIEGTPPGGTPQKLFRSAITLLDSIIEPSDTVPQPYDDFFTQAQSDSRYPQKANNGSDFASLLAFMTNVSGALGNVDPHIAGQWWNNGGVPTISAG